MTTGADDLITRSEALATALARAWVYCCTVQGGSFGELPVDAQQAAVEKARMWLMAMERAGVTAVELPPVDVTQSSISLPPTAIYHVRADPPDGKGWEITGRHIPGYDEDDVTIRGAIGWRDIDRARFDALRILAVCDALEKLKTVGPDNTGPDPSDPTDRRVPYREPGPEVQRVKTFDGSIWRREYPDSYGGRWIREGCDDPTVWNDGWMTWQRLWKEKWPEAVGTDD